MRPASFHRSNVNGIRLHVLPTDRFKTYAISVYLGTPLKEGNVTPTALVPFVLRRGTESLPETKQVRARLDDLYGAGFGFDIYKRGNYQLVQFRTDTIDDRFAEGSASMLKQALAFLGEVLQRPAQENGRLVPHYVEAEKQTLRRRIEAVGNDKMRYAAERCLEVMFEDDPYRLHPLGRAEEIEGISPESLFEHYREWLRTSPLDLYIVGNTTVEEAESLVREAFGLAGGERAGYVPSPVSPIARPVKKAVDRLEVNQGKLNMGLRTGITYGDERYPAALLYNGVLGGYAHSKLFLNVREKESLAYYASSSLDGHKGILTIQSGIEFANYDKAVSIILAQLEAMKRGDIDSLELQQTKAMIANQLREIEDSAFEMIGFDFNNVLSGRERTVASLIAAVEETGTDAIRAVAEQVELDTIYFLTNGEGGETDASAGV
ncbi:peptidase M16 [Paenibacillus sp. J31TS4]|uniref:EF-P 5-aminopentanol modification-associated protein YfmF n=1 Tax=Paenibacillus sp. J31TS4 TaxID=2807195 RepID=UPI001B270BF7|nr:pitrilysin family protein [Paenibacillus sp. J31TS4]GIP36877.1 peptidase M16 [Paenibacillus sp. J31TS4]